MATLTAYKIGRKGPKHFRMENVGPDGNPDGKPYCGPLTRSDGTHYRKTGKYALQCYAHKDLVGRSSVPIKDVIVCTPEEAAKLAHMKLQPINGSATPPAAAAQPAEASSGDRVHIPADWHQLAARDRVALAQRILGDDSPIRAKEANRVIEDYVSGAHSEADTD